MDPERLDELTRTLGGTTSRRGGLRLLAGGALGAALGLLGRGEAGAFHFGCRHVGKPCTRSGQCCSGRCRGPKGKKTCRAHDVGACTAEKDICLTGGPRCGGAAECECYVTTGGANFCSSGVGSCMACTTDTQCVRALAIPGSACVTVNHGPVCGTNCNGFQTACYGPCTA